MANANTKPTYSEFPNSNIVDEKIRAAFSSKADKATTLAGYGITDAATKREVAAKADLVGGKVPSSQLPSYVDDVLEYANRDAFPEAVSAETGKIYVAKDTNRAYRWGGTGYVEISESLAVGETSGTAYDGAKGKALADVVDILRGDVSRHAARSDNPHAVTVEQVGALPATKKTVGQYEVSQDVDFLSGFRLENRAAGVRLPVVFGVVDNETEMVTTLKITIPPVGGFKIDFSKGTAHTFLEPDGSVVLTKNSADTLYPTKEEVAAKANQSDVDALSAKVDAANTALEEVA